MHRLLSNPPRSNGIGSLSPTPKRITRSPHDELHLRSIRGFVEDRSGAVDLSDELIRTVMGSPVAQSADGVFEV